MLNGSLGFVWRSVRNHRLIVEFAVLVIGLKIGGRLLFLHVLHRRSTSKTLVANGGSGTLPVENAKNIDTRGEYNRRQGQAYISSITIWLVVTLI